tara:strand:+ start:13693 stop:14556 length:864 start_codon:yes stop_codon:yes gene_type:complete
MVQTEEERREKKRIRNQRRRTNKPTGRPPKGKVAQEERHRNVKTLKREEGQSVAVAKHCYKLPRKKRKTPTSPICSDYRSCTWVRILGCQRNLENFLEDGKDDFIINRIVIDIEKLQKLRKRQRVIRIKIQNNKEKISKISARDEKFEQLWDLADDLEQLQIEYEQHILDTDQFNDNPEDHRAKQSKIQADIKHKEKQQKELIEQLGISSDDWKSAKEMEFKAMAWLNDPRLDRSRRTKLLRNIRKTRKEFGNIHRRQFEKAKLINQNSSLTEKLEAVTTQIEELLK